MLERVTTTRPRSSRGRLMTVVVAVAVTTAACSSRGGDAKPPEPSAEPFDFRRCALSDTLVNTSHVVDVEFGETHEVEASVEPAGFGRSARDREPIYFYDITQTTVTALRHVRLDDPRATQFGDLSPGVELMIARLTNGWQGTLVADEVTTATIAVGQLDRGTPQEWLAHSAMTVGADGSVGFLGECGPELDRQFATVVDGLDPDGDRTDFEHLTSLIDGALEPGRLADFRYLQTPDEYRFFDGFMDFVIPPVLENSTRRITWYVTATGVGNDPDLVAIGSSIGRGGTINVNTVVGREAVAGIVSTEGPIDVWRADDERAESWTMLASLPAEAARDAAAVTVKVDLSANTATIEVAGDPLPGDDIPITVDREAPIVAIRS